ncbi:MAG: shikimate dehydrogenase [Rectinemataceae bacterium]|jgi:shikimate dehydrogenase
MPQSANYKSELVGVFGHPVAENPTIVMMEAAFHAAGVDYRYLTIEVLPEGLEAAIAGIRAMGFRGINLTIPHKIEVMKHLDEISENATLIGAVNTVYRRGDRLIGENTDGKGFLASLREEGMDPAGKSFVILGAGGAARAVSVELALAGAARIVIVNRDEGRGRELARRVTGIGRTVAEYAPWVPGYRPPEGTDVIANATSIGLYPDPSRPDVDYGAIGPSIRVCDVIPNPPHSAFLREAEARGARTLDGLGMLVNQGAIGFLLWTGLQAPVAAMREALAKEFG